MLVYCLKETTCTSETPADFLRTARRYVPEGTTTHSCDCQLPKDDSTLSRHVPTYTCRHRFFWNAKLCSVAGLSRQRAASIFGGEDFVEQASTVVTDISLDHSSTGSCITTSLRYSESSLNLYQTARCHPRRRPALFFVTAVRTETPTNQEFSGLFIQFRLRVSSGETLLCAEDSF